MKVFVGISCKLLKTVGLLGERIDYVKLQLKNRWKGLFCTNIRILFYFAPVFCLSNF